MIYAVDKQGKVAQESKSLGCSLIQVGPDSFVRKVCLLQARGILMRCTELAVLHLHGCLQPCSGLQEAAQSPESRCTAMKNAATAWLSTNCGWLLMMEGAAAPYSLLVKPCWAG